MYSGGQVVVSHDGRSKTFVWERDASGSSSLQYSAFYSDCDYEVLPVNGGNRVTLVYQMALAPPEPAATVGSASSVLGDELSAASATDSLLDEHFPEMRAAVEAMRQWNDDLSHTAPRHIIFPLHNKYTREDISFESLVGQDRYTHHIALELQQQTKCLLMLVNFTLVLTTNDESPDLVVERHLELHQWVYSPLSKLILKHATTHLPALELTSLWPPDYYKRRTPDVCELFDNDVRRPSHCGTKKPSTDPAAPMSQMLTNKIVDVFVLFVFYSCSLAFDWLVIFDQSSRLQIRCLVISLSLSLDRNSAPQAVPLCRSCTRSGILHLATIPRRRCLDSTRSTMAPSAATSSS